MNKSINRKHEKSQGHLIIFEGPDASGKTTASKRLARFISDMGHPCHWHSFPGRKPGGLGRFVYSIHHKKNTHPLPAESLQFLHIAAHMDLIAREIIPALRSGIWVVLDRFWWSTRVYGIASGADTKTIDLGIEAEKRIWDGITPALAFLIQRHPDESDAHMHARRKLKKLYSQVARFAKTSHPVEVIKNDGSLEDLFSVVQRKTLLRLGLPQKHP